MVFLQDEIKLLIDRVAPLGRVPRYDLERQTLELVDTSVRRFMNDISRFRRQPRNRLHSLPGAYDPLNLGIGINEALTLLIQDHPELYEQLFEEILLWDHTATGLAKTSAAEQAIVLFCHRSFGEGVFPHLHARRLGDAPSTLSIFLNLSRGSQGDDPPVLTLYDKLERTDRFYLTGYTDHKKVAVAARRGQPTEVKIHHGDAVMFAADRIPHTFSYTDDLWMVLVYDSVSLASHLVPNEALFSRYNLC